MRRRSFLYRVFLCLSLLQMLSWLLFADHIPVASASSFVIGSDPVDGSTINAPPAIVRIYFNTPISLASSANVSAFPPNASANGLLVNAGQSVINPSNPRELDTPLLPTSKLPQGSYEVHWTAVSLTDGRTTSGLIGFNFAQSSTGLAGTPVLGPSTSNKFPQLDLQGVLSVAWDWLVLLTLLFWMGILITDAFILPRNAPLAFLEQARKHSRSLQAFCLVALLMGEMINLILRSTSFTQTQGTSGIDLNTITQLVLRTNYGYFWLARVGLLTLALLFLWWNGYQHHQSEYAYATPVLSRAGKRFSQLRQQARPEGFLEMSISPRPTPLFGRSQVRMSGAIVASTSPIRTTATIPRISGSFKAAEAPINAPSSSSMASWLVLAGLILLTLDLSNEIIQLAPMPISTGIFLWLSLVAQAIWFGSLAYLGFILFPLLPVTDPDRHAETLMSLLKRATPLLLSAIAVLLVSDLFLSEATIQTPEQFLSTPYGLALLLRSSLLLPVLILTGFILFFFLPRLQRQTVLLPVVNAELPARRTRKVELAKTENTIRRTLHTLTSLAAVALICTALMNFFAPPVVFPNVNYAALVNQANTTSGSTSSSQTQQIGDLSVTLLALPARVGVDNTIILTLNNAQGQSVTDATVKLSINMQTMNMGTTNVTLQDANPAYIAVFKANQTFTMTGSWLVQVEIDRPNQQPAQLTFSLMVT
jgi:putative copper export protein/methionine-rich copper-binding protein CopC